MEPAEQADLANDVAALRFTLLTMIVLLDPYAKRLRPDLLKGLDGMLVDTSMMPPDAVIARRLERLWTLRDDIERLPIQGPEAKGAEGP